MTKEGRVILRCAVGFVALVLKTFSCDLFFPITELGGWIPGSAPQPAAVACPRMTEEGRGKKKEKRKKMDFRVPPTPRLRRTGRGNDAGGGGIIIKFFFLIAERGGWIPGSAPQPAAVACPRMTKEGRGSGCFCCARVQRALVFF